MLETDQALTRMVVVDNEDEVSALVRQIVMEYGQLCYANAQEGTKRVAYKKCPNLTSGI